MRRLVVLVGLSGVKSRMVEAYSAATVCDAMRGLKGHRAVTAAGSNGAINVWRDDKGFFRCEFYREGSLGDVQLLDSPREVRRWLKRWWKKMVSPNISTERI